MPILRRKVTVTNRKIAWKSTAQNTDDSSQTACAKTNEKKEISRQPQQKKNKKNFTHKTRKRDYSAIENHGAKNPRNFHMQTPPNPKTENNVAPLVQHPHVAKESSTRSMADIGTALGALMACSWPVVVLIWIKQTGWNVQF